MCANAKMDMNQHTARTTENSHAHKPNAQEPASSGYHWELKWAEDLRGRAKSISGRGKESA